MDLKKHIQILLLSFFYSLRFHGQEAADTAHLRKQKVKISFEKKYYLSNNEQQLNSYFNDKYYNQRGQIDSIISYWSKEKIESKSYYKYNDDGFLQQILKSNPYSGKTDTTNFLSEPKMEYDSKGNLIVHYVFPKNKTLSTKTIYNYDSASRFTGRECFDLKGKIIYSDKKTFSKTGKLISWYSYDKNKLQSIIKNHYDAFDSLIMEIDSPAIKKIKYEYISLNNLRLLKFKKSYIKKHLDSKEIYSYSFNTNGSYTQLVYYYYKQGFKRKRNKDIYYYNSDNSMYKQEHYYSTKEVETIYYTDNKVDSLFINYNGKLTRINKYQNDNPTLRLALSQTGDTLECEQFLYNDQGLLIKSRTFTNYATTDQNNNIIGRRKEEEITEYRYIYY